MSRSEEYARWVLDPANVLETGRYIKLAAERFLSDLTRTDIYFDEAQAVKMLRFGENHCVQWEGEWRGKPVRWELWQSFIFEQMYGWFRADDGLRRFEEVYVQVSKKNGKSTMCAIDINFHVMADDRVQTPKVFTAANNEEQAKICVNMAGKIIENSPDLAEWVADGTVQLGRYGKDIREIIHHERDGFVKAFSKETQDKKSKTAGGKHGVNASKGVVDEFGMSPDLGASEDIYSSMASRSEPSMLFITTAGFNLTGPCYKEKREIGIKVLEGVIKKDNYLPIIFEIDPPDGGITVDWLLANEWAWKQSNPNIDVSVKRKFLRGQLEDAKLKGGTKEVSALTLNFNIWMDSPEVFISSDIWKKNNHNSSVDDLLNQQCFVGIEIGSSGQISTAAFLFPGDHIARIKMLYFIAEKSLNQNETYLKNKDSILVDPGNEVDNEIAINWLLDEFGKYQVNSFCFPVQLKTNSIIQGLIKYGYTGNPISQGANAICGPTMEWEKMLRSEKIDHFDDPILFWMNSNCMAITKEAGKRIEKNQRVLGIYACINAVAQWKTIEATEQNNDLIIINWV